MSDTASPRLFPAGPCRAQDPSKCRYHGAFHRLRLAADRGDAAAWLDERRTIESAEKEEFAWLDGAADELNSREPHKRFFTEDDVRILLIRNLMRMQTEDNIKRVLGGAEQASPAAVEGAQQAAYRAMEYLAQTRPVVSRRTILSRPLSAEKIQKICDRLRGEVFHYVTDSLPRQQENTVMGSFRPSRDSPWTRGVVEFAPYPYDKGGMWITMSYQSSPDEKGERGTVGSGGHYESIDLWLRITEVSDNIKDFALNKYNPDSTEPVMRAAYRDTIDRLTEKTWSGSVYAKTGFPTGV